MIAARLLVLAGVAHALVAPSARRTSAVRVSAAVDDFEVRLPLENGDVTVKLSRTLEASELVVADYPLPFFIDIKTQRGFNVVTKDGSDQENKGVERVGDRLRAFTFYEIGQGLGGGGAVDMFASFGGLSIKHERKLYDATFVPWESALEKLCTNEPRRTSTVTMIFERAAVPAAGDSPPPASE